MIKLLFKLVPILRPILCLYGFHKWDYKMVIHQTENSRGEQGDDIEIPHRECLYCSAEEIPQGLMDWKRISTELGNVWELLLIVLTIGIPFIWYYLKQITDF